MNRTVLAALGAGLAMAAVTLARALRESLYLSNFPVDTLPYVTVAAAVAALPAVSLFTRRLARGRTRAAMSTLALGLAIVVAGLWPLLTRGGAAVVALYLATAVGSLLLTSGYWVIVADLFPVREAKRRYALVTAGGTVGTLVAGLTLGALAQRVALSAVLLMLLAALALFAVLVLRLPASAVLASGDAAERRPSFPLRDGLREIRRTPHLRSIAALVCAATIASTLIDFQFKAAAQATSTDPAALWGFLGTFYGAAGLLALLLQLVVAPRLLSERNGVGVSLAVLPTVLLAGAVAQVALPGVAVATALRGADNVLRRAIHRPVLEYLFVPLPPMVRRRAKPVLDTVVDTAAESVGALLVLGLVTFGNLPARSLSLLVVIGAGVLLLVGRRMAAEYARTVVARLQESPVREVYTASFSRLDLGSAIAADPLVASGAPSPSTAPPTLTVLDRLRSPDNVVAAAALDDVDGGDPDHLAAVVRQLARDTLRDRAVAVLTAHGDAVVPILTATLRDPATAFAVRRRVPALLAKLGGSDADDALVDALAADRFEVRYRAAAALTRRRRAALPTTGRDWRAAVWNALATELARDRAIWELQKLLDDPIDARIDADDPLMQRVGVRGSLSLEHAFRLLGLVLDPAAVGAAYEGVLRDDPQVRSFALEYLEQVLPSPLRDRLWPIIGDDDARARRPLDHVLRDLLDSRATFITGEDARRFLEP